METSTNHPLSAGDWGGAQEAADLEGLRDAEPRSARTQSGQMAPPGLSP